ncbi:MAG TPA: hypothetical protein VHZ24_05795 [Pirellulales bacterium]|jgi:hypothetical protein|nr:hypothetical protein [Pirellulales bacterium]
MPSPIEAPEATEAPVVPNNYNAMASNYGAARGYGSIAPSMLGDFFLGTSFGSSNLSMSYSEPGGTFSGPGVPYNNHGMGLASPVTSHVFKQSDNESPWPRTRIILSTNYFDRIDGSTGVTRQIFGFEKVSTSQRFSFGMRLPYYVASPGVTNVGGVPVNTFGGDGGPGSTGSTQSSLGDLITTFKYAVIFDPVRANVLSLGVAVTAPTGPATIANVPPLFQVDGVQHTGSIQPYMAFYKSLGRPRQGLFTQGFLASDTPFYYRDSTYVYADLGFGYIIRRPSNRWITAVVPMLEVHGDFATNKSQRAVINTAQTSANLLQATSGMFNTMNGTVSYADQINITSGVTLVLNQRSTISLAGVAPCNMPHAFNYELQLLWNTYFGPGLPPMFR